MKLFKFFKLILFVIIISVLTISCGENEVGSIWPKSSEGIEFLGRSGCSHSPAMEKNLVAAFKKVEIEKKYKYIDLASLPKDDYRRAYGTPTVLINGEDLFGMARPRPTKAGLF